MKQNITAFIIFTVIVLGSLLSLHYTKSICTQIEHNQIDLVIFLRDPLTPKMHEPDANKVVRLCDIHNIPLATNLATAELLVKALDRGDLDWRDVFR